MINVADVSHHYGLKPVLSHINLHVPVGELVALMGPNGVGKSTLLGIITGLIASARGHVEINGLPRRASEEVELQIRRQMVFLPAHPWNPDYFSGKSGLNCLQWNMFWDFGSGQVGDMGSHTMDLAWNAIDATLPTSAEGKGDPFNPEVTPVALTTYFEHPANDWRPAIKVSWHQNGHMPESPSPAVDLNKIGHGAMFEGAKGTIVADFNTRMLLPARDKADMTYYHPRAKDKLIPPLGDFQKEWINACKGNLKTSCDFVYSANLIEQMLLGLVAYRVGEKIGYDGKSGHVTDNSEADALLSRKYRDGWPLNG